MLQHVVSVESLSLIHDSFLGKEIVTWTKQVTVREAVDVDLKSMIRN